jgi:hypothetical protein
MSEDSGKRIRGGNRVEPVKLDFVGLDGWAGVEKFTYWGTSLSPTKEEAEVKMHYMESMSEDSGRLHLMHIIWEK